MANLNKVLLIGRLTRDPEVRTFANGGKVARFGFCRQSSPQKSPDRSVGR
jgi:single-stranded DNA-binding protein